MSKLLKAAALIVFVLACFGVEFSNMIALGLGLYTLGELL